MSKLITKAFQEARNLASRTKRPLILLLDEADSLAQSREESQMHHEDRAGVNALIQGIDHIRSSPVPILVVFCTNRLGAIDPAIKRRAALIHTFSRPNSDQRYEVFRSYFPDLGLTTTQLSLLARMTGEI
ncbi:AAA family ATPase, partial [Acinetobacter baumannii]|uniref:AAA family ATPase n=1 Tax=Acinetobacter baumannii TaxID=470 RepID=UPI001F0A71E7